MDNRTERIKTILGAMECALWLDLKDILCQAPGEREEAWRPERREIQPFLLEKMEAYCKVVEALRQFEGDPTLDEGPEEECL